jgi:hypothetical protein
MQSLDEIIKIENYITTLIKNIKNIKNKEWVSPNFEFPWLLQNWILPLTGS